VHYGVLVRVHSDEEAVDFLHPELVISHFQRVDNEVTEFVPPDSQDDACHTGGRESLVDLPYYRVDDQAGTLELFICRVNELGHPDALEVKVKALRDQFLSLTKVVLEN
jgi:hypothetical protein